MTLLILLAVLSLPAPPSDERVNVYDIARLSCSRAVELEGSPRLYRVHLDSFTWENGPAVSFDIEAPAGQHATIRLPMLPLGHEYPDECTVEGTLQVVRHPARTCYAAYVEFRIV